MAMPTNGEQRQGEREPFYYHIEKERKMRCRGGGRRPRDNASCAFRAVLFSRAFISQLLSCFTFVCVWLWGGISVN